MPSSNLNAPGKQSALSNTDMAWETNFHYDSVRNRFHMMAKTAVNDSGWSHQYYDVGSSSWVVVFHGSWNNSGHIYGNFTMDPVTGDLYVLKGVEGIGGEPFWKRAARYNNVTQTWGNAPVSSDMSSSGLDAVYGNGIAYHPHLYGPGDGGFVADLHQRFAIWRKSTDVCEDRPHSDIYGGHQSPAVYWPAKNCIVGGGNRDGGISNLYKFVPNSTLAGAPVLSTLAPPPIELGGNSHSNNATPFGSLHVHPANPQKLMILETSNGNNVNGQRAWESSDGASWTQVGNHPFTEMPRVVCSAPTFQCFWSVGRNDLGTDFSQIWKPAP